MFFLLPVGHDEDSVRRRPVLSLAVLAICLGVHFFWTMPREDRVEETQLRLEQALSYYLERPYLEPAEDLAPYVQRVERMLAAIGEQPERVVPRGADVRGEQRQLDELTTELRTALEADGGWPGLVPRSWTFGDLVAHMFLHAGLLHLFGNLLFLWLSGPPIEDVWGRPLFALLYLGGGFLSGLFWVGAHAGSPTPLVGASGAIAALMGAFAVRFYRSRVRMAYILLLPPFWKRGSFLAPAWMMLGLWAGREGLNAWLVDRFDLLADVAFSVHVVGFVFGALVALVLGVVGAERRWLAPAIEKTLGGEVDTELAEAHALLDAGDDEAAWAKLSSIVAADPGRLDAALALWDLGRRLGRAPAVLGPFLRAVREELRKGEVQLALEHWDEVQAEAPGTQPELDLRLRLVEAMVAEQREGRARELLAGLSDEAVAKLPIGLRVRVVRAAVKAEDPRAMGLAGAALAAPGLAPELRRELDEAQARSRLFATRSTAGASAAPAQNST